MGKKIPPTFAQKNDKTQTYCYKSNSPADSHVVSRKQAIDLSLASPPRVSKLGVRLTRVGGSDSDVDREVVLGHLLGQDAGFRPQGANVAVDGRVQVDSDAGGSGGSHAVGGAGVRLRGAGGGLRSGLGGANAGLGRQDVGVGQREREDGLALRGASQRSELSLAEALFVRVDAVDHLEVGAWGWVGVDGEALDGGGEFGESLLHSGVEAGDLRAEDCNLPLRASVYLLEHGEDVAVTEEVGCGGGAGGGIALHEGGDDFLGASGVCEISLSLGLTEGEHAKAALARHAGELELRLHLVDRLDLQLAGDREGGWRCGLAHRVVARTISHLDERRASGVSNGAGHRVLTREEGSDLHRAGSLLDTAGSAGSEAEGVSGSRHVQRVRPAYSV